MTYMDIKNIRYVYNKCYQSSFHKPASQYISQKKNVKNINKTEEQIQQVNKVSYQANKPVTSKPVTITYKSMNYKRKIKISNITPSNLTKPNVDTMSFMNPQACIC